MDREVHPGPVLYVAAEGAYGLAQRRRSWMTERKTYNTGPARWLPKAVNFLDIEWVTALADVVGELEPVMTVVDTVARSMPGGDENTSRDMGAVILGAEALQKASGGTVLLVHHTPRNGDTLRGHSSLEGAVDTAIEVRGDEGSLVLRCAKQKDDAEFDNIRLSLKGVGDSCVVAEHRPESNAEGITKTGRDLLEALAAIDLPEGVSSSRWTATSDVAVRSAYRWQKKLCDLGLVGSRGEGTQRRYTLTEQGRAAIS